MHRARASAFVRLALVLAAHVLSAGAARAQQPAAPPLQQLFDDGREALRAGEIERSARLFYEATPRSS